ncbi:WD repeat- and FYVE domain-containing protein 4 [Varanus komodoensis]|nr:WD repeat- and FYVE domain-containing protein 4 [Varanus komodoensis]
MARAPSASRWVLDGYEGPARMRKRIRLNIPHQVLGPFWGQSHNLSSQELQTHKSGSGLAPEENQAEEPIPNGGEQGMDSGQLTFFPALHESFNSEEFLEVCTERRIVLQEFAQGEKIKRRDSVVIVQEQASSEGVLLFGQKHFYLCSHFTLSHLGEVYCTRHCLSRISDSFIHGLCHKDQAVGQPACSRYAYSDIREILPTHFLLQEDALEIFFRNGYSVFLVFFNSDRARILKRFSSSMKPVLKSKSITDESINIRGEWNP